MGAASLVVGLDLGGTKLLGVVLDPDDDTGPPLLSLQVPTPSGTDDVLDALAALAADLRTQARERTGSDVVSVGVGAPGLVDREGTFRYGPNLPGVVGVPVAAELERRLGLPVVVDNDATCAAWAEHDRGASRGHDHSLLVTLGTGIGGGITVKGELLRGAHGFAGELGHVVVDPDGPLCPCGRHGCWERYASGNGLGWLAREALRRASDGDDPPGHLRRAGGDVDAVTGEHVVAAARDGDPAALAVLVSFADWLAVGIVDLVNVLDCGVVVIGGGVSGESDLFLPRARATAESLALGGPARPSVPIVAAHLGPEAGAVGAALLAATRGRTP